MAKDFINPDSTLNNVSRKIWNKASKTQIGNSELKNYYNETMYKNRTRYLEENKHLTGEERIRAIERQQKIENDCEKALKELESQVYYFDEFDLVMSKMFREPYLYAIDHYMMIDEARNELAEIKIERQQRENERLRKEEEERNRAHKQSRLEESFKRYQFAMNAEQYVRPEMREEYVGVLNGYRERLTLENNVNMGLNKMYYVAMAMVAQAEGREDSEIIDNLELAHNAIFDMHGSFPLTGYDEFLKFAPNSERIYLEVAMPRLDNEIASAHRRGENDGYLKYLNRKKESALAFIRENEKKSNNEPEVVVEEQDIPAKVEEQQIPAIPPMNYEQSMEL